MYYKRHLSATNAKTLLTFFMIIVSFMSMQAQPDADMRLQHVTTAVGEIAVWIKEHPGKRVPIMLLHGVYFDHRLWDEQIKSITDRTVIAIDMPMHGESKKISKHKWTLNDCAAMLIEVMDGLKIDRAIAVGHSWGSMTIARAAALHPQRFEALGLCNMPFKALTAKEQRGIRWQHSALLFRKFHMKQAAKALFARQSLTDHPSLVQRLINPMSKLSNKEIRQTDKAVRINADDATELVSSLKVPAIALVGESDYVGKPPLVQVEVVKGGHVSPLEASTDVNMLIKKLLSTADQSTQQ